MRTSSTGQVIDTELLREVERSLHGKLRAHRLSEGFIDRNGEDAIQQGLAEYEGALRRGSRIENPGGWIVNTAFRRALNQLRREVRNADADAMELAAVCGEDDRSPVEEEAIENAQAEQLHEAIGSLSPEQRQALGLYFFEERTTREAAELLGCAETTFRRRRDSAIKTLRERFGVPVPEQGDELALGIGLAAWLSLGGGARVPVARGPLDQAVAIAEGVRGAVGGLLSRGRELLGSILASGGGQGIGAATSGPLGRAAAGACAGALAACALAGVIGPGLGGVGLLGGARHAPAAVHRHTIASAASPVVVPSGTGADKPAQSVGTSRQPAGSQPSTGAGTGAEQSRRAERSASSQFGVESAAGSTAASPPPTDAAPRVGSTTSSASPTKAANEQFAP